MNRHCSGYTISCPKLVGRPYGPDGEYDADDQPCEADVRVTLAGEHGSVWIEDYEPDCAHEWADLTPSQQDEATEAAIEASIDRHEDHLESRYDTLRERDEADF